MRTNISVAISAGLQVTGVATLAGKPGMPLLVCLPGGRCTARYFDIPGLSLLDVAEANGFTTIALDRSGYGGSDSLPVGEVTFARNAEVLDEAITALWTKYGDGCAGVVVISHSIGSAIAVYLASGRPSWPLLGIALHGIGTLHLDAVVQMLHEAPPDVPVVFDLEHRRASMYGPDWTFSSDALARAETATAPCPYEELREVVDDWPNGAATVAATVRVPVHYVLAEYDGLWVTGEDRVAALARLFKSAPRVHASLARSVGHNIDHHYLGRALHLDQLAFALSCAPPLSAGAHRTP